MFKTIVVGIDGSETADKAFLQAIELAKSFKASLHIVTAAEPGSEARLERETEQMPDDVAWIVSARGNPTLADAGEKLKGSGLKFETYAYQGDPADALLDVAEERDADVIIVGNKGMTGAQRFLLGSVPNKVSHHAPCSVLIIRTT